MEPSPGTGNIFQNPDYIDLDQLDFNYFIDSPCIDSGDPDLTDPDGSRSEIGANYYFSAIAGDCNQDDQVNIVDVVSVINDCILFTNSNSDCGCGDMNYDQVTNVVDIVLMVNLILES